MALLRLIHVFFAATAISSASAGNSSYKGCFKAGHPEELNFEGYCMSYGHNSVSMCSDTCAFHNYTVAGVKNTYECYCGNTYVNYNATNGTDCNSTCPGNSQEQCGGPSSTSIYELHLTGNATVDNVAPVKYNYTGCYVHWDSITPDRDLPFTAYASYSNSLLFCTWICARFNYSVAGLDSPMCYCGDSFGQFGLAPSEGSCSVSCYRGAGKCGGSNGLGMYKMYYNSVFQVNIPGGATLDGAWSTWSSWSACSASCGGGVQSRSRSCSTPAPANGGRKCPAGVSSQQQSCNSTCSAVTPAAGYWTGQPTRLRNRTLESGAAPSVVTCALMCRGKAGCVSFNFIDATLLGVNCELNNQTLSPSSSSSAAAGWRHYHLHQ